MGNSFDSICSNQSQGTVPATEACSRACHLRLYLFCFVLFEGREGGSMYATPAACFGTPVYEEGIIPVLPS